MDPSASISRLESFEKESPFRFRFYLFLLTLLQFFYVFLASAILFSLFLLGISFHEWCCQGSTFLNELASELFFYVFNLPAFFAICSVLYALWIFLSSLWIRPDLTGSQVLKRIETKELDSLKLERFHSLLQRIRIEIGGPKVHTIQWNDDHDVSLVRSFRFGIFGPSRIHLSLGAPLLHFLTPEEFETILLFESARGIETYKSRFVIWLQRCRAIFEKDDLDPPESRFRTYHTALKNGQARRAKQIAAKRIGSEKIEKTLAALALLKEKISISGEEPNLDPHFAENALDWYFYPVSDSVLVGDGLKRG